MAGYASNVLQTGILKSIFSSSATNGATAVVVSGTSTAIWVALHSGDPLAGGSQNTNETTYAGYLRVITDRTTAATGWSVSGNSPASASPNTAVTFAQATTSATSLITFFSVGSSSSGAGTLWYAGPVTANITMNTNVTPSLTTASAITQD